MSKILIFTMLFKLAKKRAALLFARLLPAEGAAIGFGTCPEMRGYFFGGGIIITHLQKIYM